MAFKIFRKNCCGLDVHKTWIYACIGITDTNNRTGYKQARFSLFLDFIDEQQRIDELDSEIFRLAEPYSAALDLMRTVPGLSKDPLTAIRILSEIGADMSVFATSKHLVSWAGCCPRNDSSAQKIKSTGFSFIVHI